MANKNSPKDQMNLSDVPPEEEKNKHILTAEEIEALYADEREEDDRRWYDNF